MKNFTYQPIILRLFEILLILYSIYWILNWVNFSIEDLFVLNFFDPATENHLFYNLYNFEKINSFAIYDLSAGLFRNYPMLLERITLFFFKTDFFPNARLITSIFFYSVMFIIFLLSIFLTKKVTFSLLILTIFFGWNAHILYFQIFKPDSLYLFFGYLGIIIIYLFKINVFSIILSSFAISLSIYSKQTGLYFFPISLLTILYLKFNLNLFLEKRYFFKFEFLFIFFLILFLIIIFYLDKRSFYSFINGLLFIGSRNDFNHTIHHIKYYFIYGYFILPITILFLTFYVKDLNLKIFNFFLLITSHIFSIKMFGNVGGFSNNFIIISSTAAYSLILTFTYFKGSIVRPIIIIIIFFNSLYFSQLAKGKLIFGYEYKVLDSNLINYVKLNNQDSNILNYNFAFLNFVNNKTDDIDYESNLPILNSILNLDFDNQQDLFTFNDQLKKSLKILHNKIDFKINKKVYKYIIFSNTDILLIHPNIKNNYNYKEIYTNIGNFRDIKVYVYERKL